MYVCIMGWVLSIHDCVTVMGKATEFVKEQAIDTVKQTIVSYLVYIMLTATIAIGGYFAFNYYVDKKAEEAKQVVTAKVVVVKDVTIQTASEVKQAAVQAYNSEEAQQVRQDVKETADRAMSFINTKFSNYRDAQSQED